MLGVERSVVLVRMKMKPDSNEVRRAAEIINRYWAIEMRYRYTLAVIYLLWAETSDRFPSAWWDLQSV